MIKKASGDLSNSPEALVTFYFSGSGMGVNVDFWGICGVVLGELTGVEGGLGVDFWGFGCEMIVWLGWRNAYAFGRGTMVV